MQVYQKSVQAAFARGPMETSSRPVSLSDVPAACCVGGFSGESTTLFASANPKGPKVVSPVCPLSDSLLAIKADKRMVVGVIEPETLLFGDSGDIPNNSKLPVLLYREVGSLDPSEVETMFVRNGWRAAWRYGVYAFPHYHSTAHEALGIYAGHATIRLGHKAGQTVEVRAGDVVVIPAGVAHQNIGSSPDFHVVGEYPPDQDADLLRGRKDERPQADTNIKQVPLPTSDPVFGDAGPLAKLWKD